MAFSKSLKAMIIQLGFFFSIFFRSRARDALRDVKALPSLVVIMWNSHLHFFKLDLFSNSFNVLLRRLVCASVVICLQRGLGLDKELKEVNEFHIRELRL